MNEERKGLGASLFFVPLGLGFGVALAYLISQHLSQDAVYVIIGIVAGLVVVGLPSFAVVGLAMRRLVKESESGASAPPPLTTPYFGGQPPMIVMQQPATPAPPPVFERSLAPTAQFGPIAASAPLPPPNGNGGTMGMPSLREL